jgi:hypothetical protein
MRTATGASRVAAAALVLLATAAVLTGAVVTAPAAAAAGTPASDLRVKDCVLDPRMSNGTLEVVTCSLRHVSQVFAVLHRDRDPGHDGLETCKKKFSDTYDVHSALVRIRATYADAYDTLVCQVFTLSDSDASRYWIYDYSYLDHVDLVDHSFKSYLTALIAVPLILLGLWIVFGILKWWLGGPLSEDYMRTR